MTFYENDILQLFNISPYVGLSPRSKYIEYQSTNALER